MKIFNMILVLFVLLAYPAANAGAGPKELSEHQLTDVTVDDTMVSNEDKKDGENADDAKKKTPRPGEDLNVIKNPVDNPAELNKAEVLRLENQNAEQRVNEQIRNTLIGIPPQE